MGLLGWSERDVFFLTVLTNIHADGVDASYVERWRIHGITGGPHVVEEEDGYGGEAKHAQPSHTQDVREEHKLKMQKNSTTLASSDLLCTF